MPRVALKASKAVAQLLRARREELGFSLREVEKRARDEGEVIPFPTLARVEQGKVDPGVRRLHVLLKLYQVPVQLVSDIVELETFAGELPTSRDSKKLLEDGVRYWKAGELRKGTAHIIALQRLVAVDPKDRVLRQKAMVTFAIMASALGKYHLSLDLVSKLLREPPDDSLLVSVLVQAGVAWHRVGAGEAALAFLDRAQKHLKPDSHRERAWVLHEMAATLATLGRNDEATVALQKAIPAYRQAGDLFGEGNALGVRARVLFQQGAGPAALVAVQKAREHAEKHGFSRMRILRRIDEGNVRLSSGDAERGVASLRSALSEAVAEGDRHAEFHAHHGLWKAYTRLNQPDQARFELAAARHYVRFLDEASDEAAEVRSADVRPPRRKPDPVRDGRRKRTR